jgi:hypothetical protein
VVLRRDLHRLEAQARQPRRLGFTSEERTGTLPEEPKRSRNRWKIKGRDQKSAIYQVTSRNRIQQSSSTANMTSVSSRGLSPHSPYDFASNGETDESWQYLDDSSGASIGFLPSPASGSLNGYAIIGQVGAAASSPSALSELYLNEPAAAAAAAAFPTTTSFDPSDAFTVTSSGPGLGAESTFLANMQDAVAEDDYMQAMNPGTYLLTEQQLAGMD